MTLNLIPLLPTASPVAKCPLIEISPIQVIETRMHRNTLYIVINV